MKIRPELLHGYVRKDTTTQLTGAFCYVLLRELCWLLTASLVLCGCTRARHNISTD
jgi:hypothetical protein